MTKSCVSFCDCSNLPKKASAKCLTESNEKLTSLEVETDQAAAVAVVDEFGGGSANVGMLNSSFLNTPCRVFPKHASNLFLASSYSFWNAASNCLHVSSGMSSYLMSIGVASTLGSTFSPAIAPDELRSIPSGVTKKYVDAELTNTQTLERAGSQQSEPSEARRRPVRPVAPTGQIGWAQKIPRRPRTSSSGGTPSELEDLGLSWSRQATQDALERRLVEQRTARGWKS